MVVHEPHAVRPGIPQYMPPIWSGLGSEFELGLGPGLGLGSGLGF